MHLCVRLERSSAITDPDYNRFEFVFESNLIDWAVTLWRLVT